jgi:lipopolysaccharide assembly outer membrane protein LptD (OstA)
MIKLFNTDFYRIFFFLFPVFMLSAANIQGQKVRQIEILNADIIKSERSLGSGAQKLLGNVKFKHDDAIMTCDSAYFYSKSYSFDAFSNVVIEQGDTLFLYGDKLHYEGESRIARFRKNVKLVNDSTVLVTEHLDYNRETDLAYYFNGGVITEGDNELSSELGHYYTQTEIFHFKDSVVINNPDYNIYSDTLQYHSKTKTAYFFGPTEIIGDDNYLYCEGGWYNTEEDISRMEKHAFLKREGRILKGDTLYYERKTGFGRAKMNVELFDSAQNVFLRGHHGEYYEIEQLAVLTDSAYMIQVEGADSLYVHADTLRSIIDTASVSDEKILLAYYQVKIFREDIQGMCDSLAYIEKDSTFHMFGSPIIWADENQITATKIELKNRNQQLYRLYLRDIALLISKEDSTKYNQIRGKSMVGHFKDNDLVRLDVTGNGQTIYYAEDQGEIIGVNRAECTDLIIYLEDNQVKKVNYLVKPSGKYYPLDMFPENQRTLDGFSWNEQWRPLKFSDVFFWK